MASRAKVLEGAEIFHSTYIDLIGEGVAPKNCAIYADFAMYYPLVAASFDEKISKTFSSWLI
jgi:hypothetical protein